MGEKSFLSILKEEQKIVDEIGFKKSDMLGFLEDLEKGDGNQPFFKKQYDKTADEVAELEECIVSARKEIRKYIELVMEARRC